MNCVCPTSKSFNYFLVMLLTTATDMEKNLGKDMSVNTGGGTAKTLPSRDFRDESFGVAASK